MIEEITKIWVHLNEDLPFLFPKDRDKRLEVNIVVSCIGELNTLNEFMSVLRMERYGFFKELPTICIHCSYLFASEVIQSIWQYDDTVPRLKVNITVINQDIDDYSLDNIMRCHTIANKMNILHSFTFLQINDIATMDNLIALKTKLIKCMEKQVQNKTEVFIDISPSSNQYDDNMLFDMINKIVSEPYWLQDVPTCGLIKILYNKELLFVLHDEYGLETCFLEKLYFSDLDNRGCYFYKGSKSCKECIFSFCKMCKTLRHKAQSELFQEADLDQTKILDADWDYIV